MPRERCPKHDAQGVYTDPPECKACQRQDALAELRALLPPGSTVYTILRSVSRSGMTRIITPLVIQNGEPVNLTWRVGKVLGWGIRHGFQDGIKCDGCGSDMGHDLVHSLSYALHGTGPEKCSYHDEHRPGYTLNHRWL